MISSALLGRRRLLDLRDQRDVAVAEVLADRLEVLAAADERERDEVHPHLDPGVDQLEVLAGDGRQRDGDVRQVDPLARGQRAAHLDAARGPPRPRRRARAGGSRRRPGRRPGPARRARRSPARRRAAGRSPASSSSPGTSVTSLADRELHHVARRSARAAASARGRPGARRPRGRRRSAADRISSTVSACCSGVPWAKLSRATSIPASTIRRSTSGSRDAGPDRGDDLGRPDGAHAAEATPRMVARKKGRS